MFYRLKNCVCTVVKAGGQLHLMVGSYIMTPTSLKVLIIFITSSFYSIYHYPQLLYYCEVFHLF